MLLVRHGEALKNLEDRSGGAGTPLTPEGRRQMAAVPGQVAVLGRGAAHDRGVEPGAGQRLPSARPEVIYYCERTQVEESARILAEAWSVPMLADRRIEPLYLGVLDGLSRQAALERDRETASALDAWRRGHRSLAGLEIPAAESFDSFLVRAEGFLRDRRSEPAERVVCVVGTRSILIMLKNLLLGDARDFPRGYTIHDVPHGLEGFYRAAPEPHAGELP
jgi:broad specificity phosphatase PhoE